MKRTPVTVGAPNGAGLCLVSRKHSLFPKNLQFESLVKCPPAPPMALRAAVQAAFAGRPAGASDRDIAPPVSLEARLTAGKTRK